MAWNLFKPPRIAGQVLNRLARRYSVSELIPGSGISRLASEEFEWHAHAENAWFTVSGMANRLSPGWYLIKIRILTDMGRGNAKFYFNFGRGFREEVVLNLPFTKGRFSKRLHLISAKPQEVRFYPIDSPARFSIEQIMFMRVPEFVARALMRGRLGRRHELHRGQTAQAIRLTIKAEAAKNGAAPQALLFRRYCETFIPDREKYARWIALFEAPDFSNQRALIARQAEFKIRPTIAVVMPTYNTPEKFLRKAIESVLAQSYPMWELCIADDASTEAHVKEVVQEYAQKNHRIKAIFHTRNTGISAASNSALQLAKGDYVAFLDHDDELAAHALHFVADAINHQPSAKIIFSDEDKIDEAGNRSDPHFKSDWNPDLFFSQNYICHLTVFQRELLCRTGGFRSGLEGSQDYDLILRCLPHLNQTDIIHIPRVLYHWRMVKGSTALAEKEKSYASTAGSKALSDFFSANGHRNIKVEPGLAANTFRARHPLPDQPVTVSLIIPTRNSVDLLEPCVRSILEKTTYPNYDIIIVDNHSSEQKTLSYLENLQIQVPRVRVLAYPGSFNFSALNNYGVSHARGEIIGLINNDIEVISPDWLAEMVSHAVRPEIGCVGAKLYYPDGTIQHAGVILGLGGVAGHSHKHFFRDARGYFNRLKLVQNVSAVTAACMLVRRAVYEEVGGLDENNLTVAFNDVDFCLKVRAAGYRNLWTPYAELYHHESKSRGIDDTPEKRIRFKAEIDYIKSKWKTHLRVDPFYSPNLTVDCEDFSLKA